MVGRFLWRPATVMPSNSHLRKPTILQPVKAGELARIGPG